jgi:di/tricarboxylate transporter
LVQGARRDLDDQLPELGCLPLADRGLNLGKPRKLVLSVLLFSAALTAILLGWVSAPVALMTAAVLMVVTGVLDLRSAYAGIDWPVLVLLACMIPVGQAFETIGGAAWLADQLLGLAAGWPAALTLGVLLIVTMFLSDIINNAAAAVLMAPIGLSLARGLELKPQAFLMAVTIGASCAFLTPIGHQSNTLVFGPGGYRFGDYWRLGLPVQIVIFVVAMPLLLWIWPLR